MCGLGSLLWSVSSVVLNDTDLGGAKLRAHPLTQDFCYSQSPWCIVGEAAGA